MAAAKKRHRVARRGGLKGSAEEHARNARGFLKHVKLGRKNASCEALAESLMDARAAAIEAGHSGDAKLAVRADNLAHTIFRRIVRECGRRG